MDRREAVAASIEIVRIPAVLFGALTSPAVVMDCTTRMNGAPEVLTFPHVSANTSPRLMPVAMATRTPMRHPSGPKPPILTRPASLPAPSRRASISAFRAVMARSSASTAASSRAASDAARDRRAGRSAFGAPPVCRHGIPACRKFRENITPFPPKEAKFLCRKKILQTSKKMLTSTVDLRSFPSCEMHSGH